MSRTGPRVLMWHGFGTRNREQDPHCMFVGEDAFGRQLDLLQKRGSYFLDADGFTSGLATGRWPRRSVLVTIDDGYLSALTVAAPLLQQRAISAIMFALPGRLGGRSGWMPEMPDEQLLDAGQLRELERFGVRVECHGWDHRLLPGLPAEELQRQVAGSRQALADVLGRTPTIFAYPSGEHDAAARQAVAGAGYTCAFAVHSPAGQFALRRVDVNPTDTESSFRLKASPLWVPAYATIGRVAPVRRFIHQVLS